MTMHPAFATEHPLVLLTDLSPLILERRLTREEFIALAERFPKFRMERERDGKTTIMSPVKFGSGKRELHVGYYLTKWWDDSGEVGEVFGPNTGIELADTSMKSPDCGWISPERLAQNKAEDEDGEFLRVAPDFVIEIRSQADSLAKLKRKMANSWIANGVTLAWLIDPYKERACIYEKDKPVVEIKGFDDQILEGGNLLKGFELQLEKLKIKKKS